MHIYDVLIIYLNCMKFSVILYRHRSLELKIFYFKNVFPRHFWFLCHMMCYTRNTELTPISMLQLQQLRSTLQLKFNLKWSIYKEGIPHQRNFIWVKRREYVQQIFWNYRLLHFSKGNAGMEQTNMPPPPKQTSKKILKSLLDSELKIYSWAAMC